MSFPFFHNRYRISSARLKDWNYGASGYYFVTICVKCGCLSEIRHGESHLNPLGEIVAEEWIKTAQIRPYVTLDEWVVMPDHFHGLIGIGVNGITVARDQPDPTVETSRPTVETSRRDVSIRAASRLEAHSLGAIIGQFKSICTKRIWRMGATDFAWQPRFYDHIVRNETELHRIRQYIRANPARWNPESDRSRLRINQP